MQMEILWEQPAFTFKKAHNYLSNKTHDACRKAEAAKDNPAMAPLNEPGNSAYESTREKMIKLFNNAYFVAKEEITFTKFSNL